jgi:hypothetical protein
MPAEGVEQRRWVAFVDQGALVVLAVDFDETAPDLAHQGHGGRLIVDEAAGAPVGRLDAAQDEVALVLDGVLAQELARRDDRATSNSAVTWPWAAPWRTSEASPRAPSASDSASSRIDLPAPVSPVSTDSPAEKSISSLSMRTMSRMDRWASMTGGDRQLPMIRAPALEIQEPRFSRGSSPPDCSSR